MADQQSNKSFYLSAAFLVIVNLIPLFGVYYWGWDVGQILILYWAESAVIGFYTILKIWYSKGIPPKLKISNKPVIINNKPVMLKSADYILPLKLFLIPFFMFHFGLFMLGHLIFLLALVIHVPPSFITSSFTQQIPPIIASVAIAILSFFMSHGISFLTNYLGNKEYEKADASTLMFAPYQRIVLMHFAILLGAMAHLSLLILIFGKIIIDLWGHFNERSRFFSKNVTLSAGPIEVEQTE